MLLLCSSMTAPISTPIHPWFEGCPSATSQWPLRESCVRGCHIKRPVKPCMWWRAVPKWTWRDSTAPSQTWSCISSPDVSALLFLSGAALSDCRFLPLLLSSLTSRLFGSVGGDDPDRLGWVLHRALGARHPGAGGPRPGACGLPQVGHAAGALWRPPGRPPTR